MTNGMIDSAIRPGYSDHNIILMQEYIKCEEQRMAP